MRFRLSITPDMGKASKQYVRTGGRFDDVILDDVFTEFEALPAQEAKKRAMARGSGWVRLASTIRPYRSSNATIGVEFGGLPDAAGWEFGSNRYRQFGRYKGGLDGFAVYSLVGDGSWFKKTATDISQDVWDDLVKQLKK